MGTDSQKLFCGLYNAILLATHPSVHARERTHTHKLLISEIRHAISTAYIKGMVQGQSDGLEFVWTGF